MHPLAPAFAVLALGAARLPLVFEVNHGQAPAEARFVARPRGAIALFADDGPTFVPSGGERVRLRLRGARWSPPRGRLPLDARISFFLGEQPSRWVTAVPAFAQLVYRDVYPGVDLVFRAAGRDLEYDFVVAPGATVASIALAFDGARVELQADGRLAGERFVSAPPRALVWRDGWVEREASWSKRSGGMGIALDPDAEGRRLVIDPTLEFSTLLGGEGDDDVFAAAIDSTGAIYVTGTTTTTTNFPLRAAYQTMNAGASDAFAAKLGPTGALVYATYLGGSSADNSYGIAIDGMGQAVVVGNTYSSDFPTQSPRQAARSGTLDAFVTRLSATGTTLSFSTYLGGSGSDYGQAVAVDASGCAYVTGYSTSIDFPRQSAWQATYGGGAYDVFVSRFSTDGQALQFSTYVGGAGRDLPSAIAVDPAGNAYVVGYTDGVSYPSVGPPSVLDGGNEAFITRVATDGGVTLSRLIGGSANDNAQGVAADSQGNFVVVGYTSSPNFPTQGAIQTRYDGGGNDAFVARFDATGAIVFSTYTGGSGSDVALGVAIGPSGLIYVTGNTGSPNFPIAGPETATLDGGLDGFLLRFFADGALSYSTVFGGRALDQPQAIAVLPPEHVYVVGYTDSPGFPVTSGTLDGGEDGFIMRLGVPDAGEHDAGAPDAGVDAGAPPDGGTGGGTGGGGSGGGGGGSSSAEDAGTPPDGGPLLAPRALAAGCGCSSSGPLVPVVLAALARCLRRRASRSSRHRE